MIYSPPTYHPQQCFHTCNSCAFKFLNSGAEKSGFHKPLLFIVIAVNFQVTFQLLKFPLDIGWAPYCFKHQKKISDYFIPYRNKLVSPKIILLILNNCFLKIQWNNTGPSGKTISLTRYSIYFVSLEPVLWQTYVILMLSENKLLKWSSSY